MNINNVKLFVLEKNEALTKKMTREHVFGHAFLTLLINAPFMILGVFRISLLIWLALYLIYAFWAIKTGREEELSILRTLLYWGSFNFYLSLLTLSACLKMLIHSSNILALPFFILITVLNVIVSIKAMKRRVTSCSFKPKPRKNRIKYGKTWSACCVAVYYLTRLIVPRLNLSQDEIRLHLFILALLICQMTLYNASAYVYRAYLTRKYCPDIKGDCEDNA